MKASQSLKSLVLRIWRHRRVFLVLALLGALFALSPPTAALTTVPTKMNFQGRITNPSGYVYANGTYNMRLKLYSAASGGTAVWSEDRLVSASQGVAIANGLFSVQLGSITTLPASLFASGGLYLEVEMPSVATATTSSPSWTEGPMTPRNQLATSAYAYNSETLDGLDSADFGQITANNTWSGTNVFTGSTVSVGGAGNSAKFNVANLFNVDSVTSAVSIGVADATATVVVLDTKNTIGDPTSTNGAMYYNSVAGKFRCYQNGAWTDCIGSGGGSSGGTLQDAYDNSGSPATIWSTGAKGVSINTTAAPTTDLFNVTNTAQPTTTADANGVQVDYAGGAAAVEGAGIRINHTPGGTSGGTWSGLRIVSSATGPASGVTSYGIKLEGPTTPGAGNEVGLRVASGFDIGLDVASGGLQLSAMSDPASPAMGSLRVYAATNAGRTMLKMKGGSGIDTALQPFLASSKVGLWQANGNAATATNFGIAAPIFVTNGGSTLTTRSVTTTSLFSSIRRAGMVSTATAGTLGSARIGANQFYRSDASGRGGFYYVVRFGVAAFSSDARMSIGMNAATGVATNVEASAQINNIAFGCDAADTTFTFMHNDGAGSAVKDSLTGGGGSFPCKTTGTDFYEVRMFSPPTNGSTLYYSIARLNSTDYYEGSTTTDLPATSALMNPHIWITNNASASVVGLDLSSIYIETDN